jgi:hypothetical protein
MVVVDECQVLMGNFVELWIVHFCEIATGFTSVFGL